MLFFFPLTEIFMMRIKFVKLKTLVCDRGVFLQYFRKLFLNAFIVK